MDIVSDPLSYKEAFLQENPSFSEIKLNKESKPIGKLNELDLLENEIWMLQCPKGMDITELQNQKLKLPGRTNIKSTETVALEFNEGKDQHAFAYCNRKNRYDLRLLPVRGTIVVRNRLKAAEVVTPEHAAECCPPAKRVPVPPCIRVRHPLLGAQYEGKIEMDTSVAKRLQKADEISAQILKDKLIKIKLGNGFRKPAGKHENIVSSIEINSDDDDQDTVECISEDKVKKKKKNKHTNKTNDKAHDIELKSKKSKKREFVSEDLQWLQNI